MLNLINTSEQIDFVIIVILRSNITYGLFNKIKVTTSNFFFVRLIVVRTQTTDMLQRGQDFVSVPLKLRTMARQAKYCVQSTYTEQMEFKKVKKTISA